LLLGTTAPGQSTFVWANIRAARHSNGDGQCHGKVKLQNPGAKVAGRFYVKTRYVVAGDKAGSKLLKAQELGVKVKTEAQMLEIFVELKG
jgi:hypothetical protein